MRDAADSLDGNVARNGETGALHGDAVALCGDMNRAASRVDGKSFRSRRARERGALERLGAMACEGKSSGTKRKM